MKTVIALAAFALFCALFSIWIELKHIANEIKKLNQK